MTIARYLLIWLLSFMFTSAIDALWHLGIFRKMYAEGMKPVARMSEGKMAFHPLAGIVAQILVVTCIVFLVLYKNQKIEFLDAALIGMAAGILAITVYGITNYALLKNWSLSLTILKVIWGPILGGLSGIFVFWMRSLILK